MISVRVEFNVPHKFHYVVRYISKHINSIPLQDAMEVQNKECYVWINSL